MAKNIAFSFWKSIPSCAAKQLHFRYHLFVWEDSFFSPALLKSPLVWYVPRLSYRTHTTELHKHFCKIFIKICFETLFISVTVSLSSTHNHYNGRIFPIVIGIRNSCANRYISFYCYFFLL